MGDLIPEQNQETLVLEEVSETLPSESAYSDEERRLDIKRNWHLFKCFLFAWIEMFLLMGTWWGRGFGDKPALPTENSFNWVLQALVILTIYDQGAMAFGKSAIDSFPGPIKRIFREKSWKAATWTFLLVWWVVGLCISLSSP